MLTRLIVYLFYQNQHYYEILLILDGGDKIKLFLDDK